MRFVVGNTPADDAAPTSEDAGTCLRVERRRMHWRARQLVHAHGAGLHDGGMSDRRYRAPARVQWHVRVEQLRVDATAEGPVKLVVRTDATP